MALTPEQVQTYRNKYGIGGVQKSTTPLESKPQESFISGVGSDFSSRVESAANAQIQSIEGKQSLGSGALQTIGAGAGFVGDIIGRGISAVTPEFVKAPLRKVAESVAGTKPVQETANKYSLWKEQHPEAAANLESAVNIASLLPVVKGGGAAVETTGRTALVASGKALEAGADIMTLPGRTIKGAGSVLYKSAITPNVQEAEKILSYRAKTPFLTRVSDTLAGEATPPLTRGQTALEKGLMGTETAVGVQAKRVADELWKKEIAPAVEKSTAVMTKDELFTPALERIAATTDPTRKAALQDAYDSLLEDYSKFPESFDLSQAQALKRDIAEFTPTKIFKGKEVANEMRTLQADMADAIRQKTYTSLADESIKKKYLDWANLSELQKVGVKAISEGSFKGGSGTLISGLWDMATTPVKTIGGQVLYRVGDKLEFSGSKGIKTFGQYLQSKGYTKPTEYALPTGNAMGLSTKDVSGIPASVRPDLVAKMIDVEDRNLIAKFLDGPLDIKTFEEIQPLFAGMKIEKADLKTQIRFLEDVLQESNL